MTSEERVTNEIRGNSYMNINQKLKKQLKIYGATYSSLVTRHSLLPLHHYILLISILLPLTSCVKYSFGGGDIGTAQSMTINNFYNEAGGGPPNLTQVFTEKLRDYYQQNTKLDLVNAGGDWLLEGRIVGYQVLPVAPTGNETAGLNRLTIRVYAVFLNTKIGPGEAAPFEQEFSFYQDFQQTQSLSEVEQALIDEILNRIVFDIFTKTTSNW